MGGNIIASFLTEYIPWIFEFPKYFNQILGWTDLLMTPLLQCGMLAGCKITSSGQQIFNPPITSVSC